MKRNFTRNKTLFGLRTNQNVRIKYDPNIRSVVDVEGIDVREDDIDVSDQEVFNTPAFIMLAGVPYFPAKYEFIDAPIYYHARQPPTFRLRLVGLDSEFDEQAKTRRYTVKLADLREYDRRRKRVPTQYQVMDESAREHVQRLIDSGHLIIPDDVLVTWHWCHLIAFSMLPTEKAQQKRNLVCGTAACNGHMANIEAAVKMFVYETERPLALEVTATHVVSTQVAKRIRYRVHERRSGMLFTEYFDALTDVRSDFGDFETVYTRLMAEYKNITAG